MKKRIERRGKIGGDGGKGQPKQLNCVLGRRERVVQNNGAARGRRVNEEQLHFVWVLLDVMETLELVLLE